MFSYYEYIGSDYDADMAKMAADPETQRWWEVTDPCQQPIETATKGEWWAGMKEVFHTEWNTSSIIAKHSFQTLS